MTPTNSERTAALRKMSTLNGSKPFPSESLRQEKRQFLAAHCDGSPGPVLSECVAYVQDEFPVHTTGPIVVAPRMQSSRPWNAPARLSGSGQQFIGRNMACALGEKGPHNPACH